MATDLGTAFGRIVIDTNGASRGIGGLSAKLGAFGKGPGLVAVAALGGIAAGLGSAVSGAMQFDKAMSAVSAVSGATAEEMASLREAAISLGASTTFTAREVAGAQGELVKAGVSVQDVLGGALQGSLSLAAAGELELGQAATIAANAMNLFGLQGADVTHIADALATAANTTTADVADFGIALSQGGSAAKAAGLSFDETTTILESLATIGVKNSDAGTSMKNALIQVLSPTKKAAAAMAAHNLVLTDARGNFVNAAEASRRLRAATEGMTAAQRVNFLSTIAGTDGFRTLLALIDTGPRRLEGMRRGLDREGSAAETARKRQNNLAGDVEKLGGAFDSLKLRVGEGLQAPLRSLAQATTGVLDAIGRPGALEAFAASLESIAGSLGIPDAAVSVWEGLRATFVSLEPLALGTAAAFLGLVHAGAGVADAAGSALSALSPLTGALSLAAGGALALAGAVAGMTGGLASTRAGTALLAAAALALTGALIGVRVAALASAVALRVQAITGAVVAFGQLAATVRTAAEAMALFRATAVGSAAFAALASPVGLVAAGVALLGGGIAALASGMFRSKSPAIDLAGALEGVDRAAKAAAGSVASMRATVDKLADAHSRTRHATLALEAAERDYAAATAGAGAGSSQAREAALRLSDARTELARATRDENAATQTATRTAAAQVTSLVNLALAQGTAKERATTLGAVTRQLSGVMGRDAPAAIAHASQELNALNNAQATTGQRLAAVQRFAGAAAAAIKGTSPAANAARKALEGLATAKAGDLRAFVVSIETGMANGKTRAQATSDAIKRLLAQSGDAKANLAPLAASITSGGATVIAAAREVKRKAQAELRGIDPRKPGSPPPVSEVRAGMAELVRTVAAGGAGVQRASERAAAAAHREWTGSAAQLATARSVIERNLAAIDAAESVLERRRDARRAVAQARHAVAIADTKDELKAANAQKDQAIAAHHELERVLRQEAGDRARVAAQRAPLTARTALLERIGTIRSDAEAAGSDLAAKVEQSLSESFARAATAIDANLETALAGVGAAFDRTAEAIGRGVTADLSGIAGLGAGVRAALEGVAANLATALQPWSDAITEASGQVDMLDAELDRRQRARQDRTQRAALETAQAAKAGVDAEVARLEAVQDGARTDSERAAAGRLLADALTRQKAAAEDVGTAQEDISTTVLERARTSWQGQLDAATTARDALIATAQTTAQGIAEAARTTAEAGAKAARDALDVRLADVRVTLERNLGNLGEALATGNGKAAKAAVAGIDAVLGSPDVKAALTASGNELGVAFSKGLARSRTTVEGAARDLADAIRRYLKLSSPAETGPLAWDFRRSGLAIGTDLAVGLRRSAAAVAAEAGRLASAAFVSTPASSSGDAGAGGGIGAGGVVQNNTFVVQRPVEDVRTWSERAMFEARLAGGRV